MIVSFRGKLAEALWSGTSSKGFPSDLIRPAQRKLAMLASAIDLNALRQPPGNFWFPVLSQAEMPGPH